MRLIDVQPVLDYSHNKNIRVCTVDLLEALPIVDAAPVVRGEWIVIGMRPTGTKDTHYCSICKAHGRKEMNYCPNCGAKMEDKPWN